MTCLIVQISTLFNEIIKNYSGSEGVGVGDGKFSFKKPRIDSFVLESFQMKRSLQLIIFTGKQSLTSITQGEALR